MAINKTSSYRQAIKGIVWWAAFIAVCSVILYIKDMRPFIPWAAGILVFGWLFTFLSNARIADIELHDDGFSLVTLLKKTRFDYNDIVIYEVTRNPRPFMFLIHTDKAKLNAAYTDDSYSRIKEILVKTKSGYGIDRFDAMLSQFAVKPYPSE
jgi:uncharacterized membrane protein